jgi:hypothetical protein
MNLYSEFVRLLPGGVQDVGEVLSVETDGAFVELVSGAVVKARGTATVGQWVYLEDDAIIGPAPASQDGQEIEV